MRIARVYIASYNDKVPGDILDVVDINTDQVLEGTLKYVEVADDFNKDLVDAVIAEDGSISFVENAEKVAANIAQVRDNKLSTLRALRSPLLSEVDIMVNDLALGDTALTQAQVKDYRQALKDVTTPYKDFATDSDQAAALDALDVLNFTWPTKPS